MNAKISSSVCKCDFHSFASACYEIDNNKEDYSNILLYNNDYFYTKGQLLKKLIITENDSSNHNSMHFYDVTRVSVFVVKNMSRQGQGERKI